MKRIALYLLASAGFLPGCHSARLDVSDSYSLDHLRSVLHARVEGRRIGEDYGLPLTPVKFFAGEQLIGEAHTDIYGEARLMCELPPETTQYRATTSPYGRELADNGVVFRWSPGRTVIICDIDNTICRSDYNAIFSSDLIDPSPPVPGAAEALRDLNQRFELVYLTLRPAMVREKTLRWLNDNNFPRAPLVTTPRRRDALLAEDFKIRTIRAMQQEVNTVAIGIGNSTSDAEAYGACGLLTLVINDEPDSRYSPHVVVLRDWAMLREFFEVNAETLEAPEKLQQQLKNEEWLQRPLLRYRRE